MEKIINNWTEEKFLEEYCKVLDKDEQFKGSTITKKEDGTIEIITKEKDKFIVTEDTVEYKGNIQENTPPTEEGNKEPPIVTIGTNGGIYTILAGNTTAEVTTTITVEDFSGNGIETLQYQFSTSETIPEENDVNWKDFANGETITQNLTGGVSYLYTKVIDKAGNQAIDVQKSNAYIVNYQVKYDANGGTGAPEEQTKTHGSDLTLSTQVPTRTYYNFLGWATSNTGSASYQAGGNYSQDSSITLYAKWQGVPSVNITTHPSNKNLTFYSGTTNGDTRFSVVAEGPGLSYQWYGRAYGSNNWVAISGATNANYDIPKTVTNFSSLYRYYSCVVTSTIDGQTTNKRSNEAELTYAASV